MEVLKGYRQTKKIADKYKVFWLKAKNLETPNIFRICISNIQERIKNIRLQRNEQVYTNIWL